MKFKVTTETTVYAKDACQYIREEDGKEKPVEEEQAMVEEPKGLMARRTESGI